MSNSDLDRRTIALILYDCLAIKILFKYEYVVPSDILNYGK